MGEIKTFIERWSGITASELSTAEGRPPFVLVVDVGNVIELYSEFSRSGATALS